MIRKATADDAEAFCHVITQSIITLCTLDHKNDRQMLNDWLANKTPENCKKWIEDTNLNSFVAEENQQILGISQIGHNGHLYLCYVLPGAEGKGIGKQLLQTAEQSVITKALTNFTLESTQTARGFYEQHGYQYDGKSKSCLKLFKPIKP